MKCIDSVNARPDMFGKGKSGFHDNADLSDQDATYLTPDWLNTVQEELSNAIEGFGVPLDSKNNKQLYSLLSGINQNISNVKKSLEDDLTNLKMHLTINKI